MKNKKRLENFLMRLGKKLMKKRKKYLIVTKNLNIMEV